MKSASVVGRGTAMAVVLLVAFIGLMFLARERIVDSMDLRFTKGVQAHRNPVADELALGFTFCGNSLTLIVLAVVLAGLLIRARRPHAGALCVASLLGLPMDDLLKAIVGRSRPSSSLVQVLTPVSGFSFPSGHAMGSTVFYGCVAFLAWSNMPRGSTRVFAVLCPIVFALGVSLSRIYLGVHWLSDVVGGWAAGLIVLIVLAIAYWRWPDLLPGVAKSPFMRDARSKHPLA